MWELLVQAAPLLPQAVGVTLFLGIGAFVLGSVLGIFITLARISTVPPLRWLAYAYVSVFRGTPLLIQLLLIYFGLPQMGIVIEPIPSALIALTLFAASYLSENFRSGISAVDRGQWEAASSIGMTYAQSMKRIVLPQALRVALPPVGSRFIALMKDTSLASTVTVVELTRLAEKIGSSSFKYLEMFFIVGVIYWAINQLLTFGQTYLERRMSRSIR